MAVMAFAGMSVAQDVYTAGYFMGSNGEQRATIYKNGNKLHDVHSGGGSTTSASTDVEYHNGDVFWVENSMLSSGEFYFGDVFKNSDRYLSNPVNSGSHINAIIHGNNLWSVGCKTIDGVQTAVAWKNDNNSPQYTLGSGSYKSEATDVVIAPDAAVWICGVQYTSESVYHGVIWRNGTLRYTLPDNCYPKGIAIYDGSVYIVANVYEDGVWYAKVYRDGSAYYTLTTASSTGRGFAISIDAGDVYVSGWQGNTQKVWKNGEDYYNVNADVLNAVWANSTGVYCAGDYNNHGRVWKDGSVLFDISDCDYTYGIYITDPECDDVFALPFTESFENGNTNWTCWTKRDVDNDNGDSHFRPFWDRRSGQSTTGDYCAYHGWGANDQEGWLISPKLYLEPDQIRTTLTFESKEGAPDDYRYEGVWISTSTTNPSSFTEVWSQTAPTGSWKTVEIDLTDYQDQSIYIAFKYTGINGHTWYIDDVNVQQTAPEEYTVTTYVNPAGAGTVEGGGVYPEQTNVYLTAHPNPGWVFDHWTNGFTDNPYMFTIVCDVTYTAYFLQEEYTLTLNASPSEGGLVAANPAGPYHYGDMVTLTATPNPGYTFVSWSDGNTNAMRTVEVTGDATYSAIFAQGGTTMYTVTVVSENPLLGSVTGGGTFPAGTVIQISATPNLQARFVSWDDGNTDNPRTIVVTGDVTYIARFEALQSYTITVVSANPAMGTVDGGGTFMEGTETSISATPLAGYYFIGWNDGNADNPRTITVTQNATYIAQFASSPVETFTLTVMCNDAEGSTIGSGTYTAGSTATIAAFPNNGYAFDKWNDGNMENPRQVVVNSNMTFVAFFKNTGIGENEGRLMVVYPNPANSYIRIEGLEANSEVKIYNAMGALVKVVSANAEEEISIADLASGLYVVRCGNATLRFVKEQ